MHLGPSDITRLNGSQSHKVLGLGVFRANLEDGFEVLESFRGLPQHEVGPPSELESFRIGGVLREYRFEIFESILGLVLIKGECG